MKNSRIVPEKFPFTSNDGAAMKEATVFLQKWMQDIDDRLFQEGYEFRNGALYELNSDTSIDTKTYWKRCKEKGLRS